LFCGDGSEFTSQALDLSAYQDGVKIDASSPAKPTDNVLVESVNGIFPVDCRDSHWVYRLPNTMQRIEGWRAVFDPRLGKAALSFTDAAVIPDPDFAIRADVGGVPELCRFFTDERGLAFSRHFRSGNTRLRHCHLADRLPKLQF